MVEDGEEIPPNSAVFNWISLGLLLFSIICFTEYFAGGGGSYNFLESKIIIFNNVNAV